MNLTKENERLTIKHNLINICSIFLVYYLAIYQVVSYCIYFHPGYLIKEIDLTRLVKLSHLSGFLGVESNEVFKLAL